MALASPLQGHSLLQELFADIALEIDDQAKDIILSREEGAICPAEDDFDSQLCFHDVLADRYVWTLESGKRILDLIVGIELRMTISTRLKTCLYSFTSPGGPMFPPELFVMQPGTLWTFFSPLGNTHGTS